VVNGTDVSSLVSEGNELVSSKVMVMVSHRISEAADYGLGNVYIEVRMLCRDSNGAARLTFVLWLVGG
jgi:hypothetical protein